MATEEAKAVTAADGAPMDLDRAIPEVLKYAMQVGGVVKGVREVCKGLDRREANLCILAEDCDEENYGTLVEALAFEHDIPLIKIKNRKQLGEWIGTCKLDKEGKARKVVGNSACLIKDFGQTSTAREFLLDYLKTRPRPERVIRATTTPSADKKGGEKKEEKAAPAGKGDKGGKKKK